MKYFLSLALAVFLTGCLGGGDKAPALPPELQSNPLNTTGLPPVAVDPLSGLPPIIEKPAETTLPETDPVEEVETTPEPTSTTGANCEAIVSDLETSFSDMNFCSTDADCAVAEGSCPFGCYLFHNAKIDFADYQPTLDTYRESCTPCTYKCGTKPRVSDRRCKEGRCTDVRFK